MLARGAILHRRYVLERRLGQGDLGSTFLATDRLRGGPVALKVVRSVSADRRALLEREFERLRGVVHPALVEVLDFGALTLGGVPAVFQSARFVEGVPLD